MITRMSELFLRTLRDDPADAETAGHSLLVRAGFVRRVASGVYTYLPLGQKVLRKVSKSPAGRSVWPGMPMPTPCPVMPMANSGVRL